MNGVVYTAEKCELYGNGLYSYPRHVHPILSHGGNGFSRFCVFSVDICDSRCYQHRVRKYVVPVAVR